MNIAKLVFTSSFLLFFFYGKTAELKPGFWQGILTLNESTELPFLFSVNDENKLTIYNAEEKIHLDSPTIKNDSITYSFLAFKTYLILSVTKKKFIEGFYVYPDRKQHSRIAFYANFLGKDKPTCNKEIATDISGRWKTMFSINSDNPYPAIGKFQQNINGKVTGTFLTETGDYRYLDGYFSGNKLTLSCFDGSHAFLFEAKYKDKKLHGTFYSGSHWSTNWVATRNDSFQLKNPDSLTYLIKDEFSFIHPDTSNNAVVFPNEKTEGKVVIIQIIGTWCPNCLDETNFYKKLYKKYHNEGLEIIGIAYEYPKEFNEQINRVKRYTNKKEVPYQILIGGQASKKEASSDFNMLNEISSFPTSIIINKKGEVVKIHTGFNGPGTGDIYDQYVDKTIALIEKLLKE
jgi:thiol-disulfide isomerase/thioredoxin